MPILITAQNINISFFPAVYYTQGTYNSNKYSSGVSLYSTIGINYYDYLTIGYDKTKLTSKLLMAFVEAERLHELKKTKSKNPT